MISIRQGMFETNSSSCHVFVYDTKASVTAPKTVTLVPNSDDSMLNILFNDYYRWYRHRYDDDDMDRFLMDLLSIGVIEVKCSDQKVVDLFERLKDEGKTYSSHNKEGLIQILFNDTTKLTTMEDFEVCQESVDEEFGKGYKYYSIRLS
ncbi:MAG: hypothetical protein VZS44_08115 [Bacilli bacterium]|nr:hypothetical protein [Bacilli bacterium]